MTLETVAPMPRQASLPRIPSLDGLRAISILFVISLHALQRFSLSHHVSTFWFGLFNGQSGVFIFFEISGFLITSLLLEEHHRRGSISLRGFYLRRAFRILPPLYLYIAVATLLGIVGRTTLSWSSVWSSLFFFHNIPGIKDMWSVEHLWSISAEEQFYLVWPFVLVASLAYPAAMGRKLAGTLAASIILVSPILRVVLSRSHNSAIHQGGVSFLRFDFIMYGCLVALLQHTRHFESVYRGVTKFWWGPPTIIILCNFLSARFANYIDLTVGYTIDGFAIAMFLLWCTRNADTIFGRILNLPPVVWVGALSYSIYLWQTLWLHSSNGAVFAPLTWVGEFPQSLVGILLCAAVSYYVVEQPSLRLRAVVIRQLRLYRLSRSPR